MKKFCLTGLALMLILCMTMSAALAVDTMFFRPEEGQDSGSYRMVRNMTVLGDAVYMLSNTSEETYTPAIWYWKPGMEDAEIYLNRVFYTGYFDTLERAQTTVEEQELDVDLEHGVSRLFSDGERLMGLNHLSGKVFTIAVQDGKAVYEDVVTFKDMSPACHVEEDYSYFISPDNVICMGDKLLWLISDWDSESGESVHKLLSFDLKDGSVKTAALENPRVMAAYKDGKVLVLDRKESDEWDSEKEMYRPMTMLLYDPATDKSERLGEFEYQGWQPYYLLYSEGLDALLYNDDTRVMGLFNNFKDKKQVSFLPNSYPDSSVLLGDSLVCWFGGNYGMVVRTVSADFKADNYVNTFRVSTSQASRAFFEAHPQIPIYPIDGDGSDAVSIDLMMRAGADAPDLLQLNVSYSVYTRLAERGYCADLSGYPEIAEFVNDLYPAYKDAVTGKNGEIYAVPTYAYSYDGFFINKKVMEEMGLTVEDIPTNLVELCEFATRWNDEFVEQFPNYTLLEYVSDYKASMFELMINRYIAYCQSTGTELKFDTPIFREMIAALEAMEVKALNESTKSSDPEVSDYKQGLIWKDDLLVGYWADFAAEDSDRIFIPMGLTKDAGYCTGVQIQVVFLNPKSAHKEAAVELLKAIISTLSDQRQYVLRASKSEPLENPEFEYWLSESQEELERLEKKLAEAPEEEKKDWEAQIADQKDYIERYTPKNQYMISPGELSFYRDVVLPYVYVSTPSFLVSSDENDATKELKDLIKRYQDGNCDADKFIREADGKLMTMQMEKQ